MLEAVGLTKRYLRHAVVDAVNFRVAPGEVLGYLGPNGSGKSTTVKMIVGLIEPSEGEALYRGRNIREDIKWFQSRLGYVPEEAHVYPYLTGREFLQLTGRLRGMEERALNEKIDAMLNLFSLYEQRHGAIASYSKGMKQKILLTAALLHDPEVVIFDEPLSGLDVTTAMVFKSLVRALSGRGKVILYSSHVLEVVEKVCTKVLILRQGAVAAYDSVAELRRLMASPSLEDVFAQLAVQEDTEKVAAKLDAVIGG